MTSHSDDASISVSRWYPIITPYRLVFIATTGGLGILKAVLVSKGDTTFSTTVEWIAAVVVALIFQFLGSYEYNNACPQYMDWMFCYDFLGRRINLRLDYSDTPPLVTEYRLVVSALFAAFGLAKMFCGYLDLSTAMNTLDWIIAVPLTLGLYCIGLYEEKKSSIPRRFFDVHYSIRPKQAFRIGLFGIVYLGVIALCVLWLRHWLGQLHSALMGFAATSYLSSAWQSSAWSIIFKHVQKGTTVAFYLIALEIGAWGLIVIMWPMAKRVCSKRRAHSIRYHAILVAIVALYVTVTILCTYAFLCQLCLSLPVYELWFEPRADSSLSLPMRIVGPLLMMGWTVILAVPAIFLPFSFNGVFERLKFFL